MWVKSLGLSPEFLLSLNSYFYKNVGMSFSLKELDICSKVLANISEKHADSNLVRKYDFQHLPISPARENLASLLIWSVNVAKGKINLRYS